MNFNKNKLKKSTTLNIINIIIEILLLIKYIILKTKKKEIEAWKN